MPSYAEQLQAQISQLQAELERVTALPAEPDTMYSPAIVVFDLVANTGKPGRKAVRTYAAFKTRSLYYLAGPDIPPGLGSGTSWAKILDWIQNEGGTELAVVTQMDAYGTVSSASAAVTPPRTTNPRTRSGRARPQERRGDK